MGLWLKASKLVRGQRATSSLWPAFPKSYNAPMDGGAPILLTSNSHFGTIGAPVG